MNYDQIQNTVMQTSSTGEALISFPSMRTSLPSNGHQTAPFIHSFIHSLIPYEKLAQNPLWE